MATDTDHAQHEEQEIIRKLFFLMTTLCEDGAAVAAEGQAPGLSGTSATDTARRLHATGQALMVIADAARALAELRR